ncbi:MAG: sugar ABC transporter permease [Trueperaceae bacterium]|nr:MAG: sugar ABC transporter permease [Trueperaceae bacterium]
MSTASTNQPNRPVRRPGRAPRQGRWTAVLILLPPALLIFTVFVVLPILGAGYMSLYTYKGYGPLVDWQGIDNYVWLFTKRTLNSFFEPAIRNTVLLLATSLFVQLPLALLCALLIYENTPVNNFFRLIFFLPFVLSEIATGLIWVFMLDGRNGILAPLYERFLGGPYFLMEDKTWSFGAVLLALVWKYFGYHMIIYIAGLQGVPQELIESAQIDGASYWQTALHVKIPLISYAIKLSVFFAILGSLQVFDLIIGLYGRAPPEEGQTLATFIYEWGLSRRQRYGIASSASIILFTISIVVGFTYQYLVMGEQSMFRRKKA